MIDAFLLEILVCPETKKSVALGSADVVTALNRAIDKGSLKNRSGRVVSEKLGAVLVRDDNAVAYAVRDDIPVMLIEEQIALDQIR